MTMVERLKEDIEIVFQVGWEFEDELPQYIMDEGKLYDSIFLMSRIRDGVRMFPYIKIDDKRHFLSDLY